MFHLALYQPCIAPNTGNIIRLAANTGCQLHLIEPLGFDLEEKKLRRAGLDYHEYARIQRHPDFAAFSAAMAGRRLLACTTKGSRYYHELRYQADDVLLFGNETSGLPAEVLAGIAAEQRLRIPMQPNNRSLNLANAVAIVCYEGWRQLGFSGAV